MARDHQVRENLAAKVKDQVVKKEGVEVRKVGLDLNQMLQGHLEEVEADLIEDHEAEADADRDLPLEEEIDNVAGAGVDVDQDLTPEEEIEGEVIAVEEVTAGGEATAGEEEGVIVEEADIEMIDIDDQQVL